MLPPDTDRTEAARQLGHDLYCRSLLAPEPAWEREVMEGFYGAEARRLPRQAGDRFVRKWLQLRGSALRRRRIVDAAVTPGLLQQLDVDECPILRVRLTHGTLGDADWSIDRLNNDGAYAPRNLAVISTRANAAKADLSFDDVYARARLGGQDGLAPAEWMRMAALMVGPCFAEAPASAPILPLLAPLPNLTVRSATQMIQYVLTTCTASAADKNQVIKQFGKYCIDSHARTHCRQVAEYIHLALKDTPNRWDVWQVPRVMAVFLQWRASLPAHAWAALGEMAMLLSGGSHVGRGALGAWHLRSGGHFAENWRR